MSIQATVAKGRRLALFAGIVVASIADPAAIAAAAGTEALAIAVADPARTADESKSSARAPFAMLIARVYVNTVNKGDVAILRDAQGHVLVPVAELDKWGLALPRTAPVIIDGERYTAVADVEGLEVRFDPKRVTLELQVAAQALPKTAVNLGPQHRPGVVYPAENSFFLNYGLNASGDDSFGQRRYQFATELGARTGNWLFYNTTDDQWGNGTPGRFTRLLTNVQYEDRPNLRRLTLGDFFTPTFDLATSVPLGGASFTKFYSMDPYFIQYPTAAFQTQVTFPSTVQVRVDGNLIAQRQVPPGPVDITNITGVTGGQNVSVVIRDPFGREQVLQRPFFFATNAGLAQGLHEYSYNVGFLRRQYGIASGDYGPLAAAAFHRYAFTDQLTLGLRGQATQDLYNIGPFGTFQNPAGIFGVGASIGGRDSRAGPAASAAYSYTGGNFSLNVGLQYLSRDFAQLSDLESAFRARSNQYVSGSVYSPTLGTLTATYTSLAFYDAPKTRLWNLNYTRGMLGGKALLALDYARTLEPQSSYVWLLSLRYFFDSNTSFVAAAGGTRDTNTQALSLEKAIPQGEGLGYTLMGGHVGDGSDAAFGRAFVQANAAHATFGAEYARASRQGAAPGLSQVFVAGSIGAVGGSVFAGRPIQDSFALIRVPGLREVPVYANGWYAGKTDASGEVVATNIASYYDNFIAFGTGELPLDFVFPSSEKVISPPLRSGTLVAFVVKRNHAVYGALVELRDGQRRPLEFREIRLTRGDVVIQGFTARRGEFYIEGVEPGQYRLVLEGTPACSARIVVPDPAEAMTDVGSVVCGDGQR